MLNNGNLHYNPIINACRPVLRKIGSLIVLHCFKEQNSVTDALVKDGAKGNLCGIHKNV